jgi:hypothetical protein
MTVKIQFGLPTGSGGMAAGMHAHSIRKALIKWAAEHGCALIYSTITVNHRPYLTVEFPSEQT